MAGIKDWFSRVFGSAEGGDADSAPQKTEAGRFTVTLSDVGPDRAAVVETLRVITPLSPAQLEDALDQLPMTVRIGLTHTAARSVRDRLNAQGASAQIEEIGD